MWGGGCFGQLEKKNLCLCLTTAEYINTRFMKSLTATFFFFFFFNKYIEADPVICIRVEFGVHSKPSQFFGLFGRVFANGPGDQGSIPGQVIPKTKKKWYLMPPCLTLSLIRYRSRVKWSNLRKELAPSPTPWCSSYWKSILQVALDYDRQLYILMQKGWKILDYIYSSYLFIYSLKYFFLNIG